MRVGARPGELRCHRRRGLAAAVTAALIAGQLVAAPAARANLPPRPADDVATDTPRPDKTHWQREALRASGVADVAGVSPDACAHRPLWGHGEQFHATNAEIVERGYGYYRQRFLADDRLLWAGLARLAGHPVWFALQRLEDAKGDVVGLSNPVVSTLTLRQIDRLQTELLHIQKDIFCDLAWQHEAFAQAARQGRDPLFYLRPALAHAPELHDGANLSAETLLGAWRSIAAGDDPQRPFAPLGPAEATRILVRREQGPEVAQPHYDHLRALVSGELITAVLDWLTVSPTAGREFDTWARDQPGIQHLTTFSDRMGWINAEVIPPFQDLHRGCPGQRDGCDDATRLNRPRLPCLYPWQEQTVGFGLIWWVVTSSRCHEPVG